MYFVSKQRATTNVPGRRRHSGLGGSLRAATKTGRHPEEIISLTCYHSLYTACPCTPDRSRWKASVQSPGEDEVGGEHGNTVASGPLTHQELREPAPHRVPERQRPPRAAAQHPGRSSTWEVGNGVKLSVLWTSLCFKNLTEEMAKSRHHVG